MAGVRHYTLVGIHLGDTRKMAIKITVIIGDRQNMASRLPDLEYALAQQETMTNKIDLLNNIFPI